MDEADERSAGMLVITAWRERPDPTPQIRVRITRKRFDRNDGQATSASTEIEDVCEIVRAWLRELVSG